MGLFQSAYIGKYAVIKYGDRILNCDSFRISINTPVLDITNIGVYGVQQNRLPARRDDPLGRLPLIDVADQENYQANFGAPAQYIFGGRREYKISLSGKVYTADEQKYMPNVGDYVRIRCTNNPTGINVARFFDVYCIVTDFNYENDVKSYASWSIEATGTFDENRFHDSNILPIT